MQLLNLLSLLLLPAEELIDAILIDSGLLHRRAPACTLQRRPTCLLCRTERRMTPLGPVKTFESQIQVRVRHGL